MRFLAIVLTAGLLVSGCAWGPQKKAACEGSNVKGCSPVIYFNLDSDVVSPYGKKRLDWAYDKMMRWEGKRMLITGYASELGSEDYNMDLSERRAKAVKEYLVGRGIDPNRIDIDFKGKTELICEDDINCESVDRRVIIKMYNPKHWWIF